MTTYTNDDLVRSTSADGWSLHAPETTPNEIATGGAIGGSPEERPFSFPRVPVAFG